jgi:hypothetical protein
MNAAQTEPGRATKRGAVVREAVVVEVATSSPRRIWLCQLSEADEILPDLAGAFY